MIARSLITILFLTTIGQSVPLLAQPVAEPPKHVPILLGVATISGDAPDLSGLEGTTREGAIRNRFGGVSALAYAGVQDEFFALGDRGPDDGDVRWECRFHRLKVQYTNEKLQVSLLETTMMTDKEHRGFSGLAGDILPSSEIAGRLDPEGISLSSQGRIFVSDEYGPKLIEFNSKGEVVRDFQLPQKFQVKHPAASKKQENRLNSEGRQSNRGFEGLAIEAIHDENPESLKALFVLQSPLIQDCERDEAGNFVGSNVRLLELDLQTGKTREFVFVLDSPEAVISEILAIGDQQYLLIERDDQAGEAATMKNITRIDVSDATDVSEIQSLRGELPPSIEPVQKSRFIDLLDPKFELCGAGMPEKIEGLALGPELSDGSRTLLIATDNDFEESHPTCFYLFHF